MSAGPNGPCPYLGELSVTVSHKHSNDPPTPDPHKCNKTLSFSESAPLSFTFHNIYLVLHVRLCIFHDMDQELEAVMNSGPRLVTPKTWAILIDFAHSSPTPVTTNFVEYVFDVCMLYSLLPSVPYAVVLLLHRLHGISPLEGWMV